MRNSFVFRGGFWVTVGAPESASLEYSTMLIDDSFRLFLMGCLGKAGREAIKGRMRRAGASR